MCVCERERDAFHKLYKVYSKHHKKKKGKHGHWIDRDCTFRLALTSTSPPKTSSGSDNIIRSRFCKEIDILHRQFELLFNARIVYEIFREDDFYRCC